MTMHFVPYITTPAGACLTQANWHELNIQYAVCSLEHILIKPGLAFWQNGMNLKTYLAWDRTLFLDASGLDLYKDFVIKSPYDGARIKIDLEQLWTLVEQLQPDGILLPAGISETTISISVTTNAENGIRFEFQGQHFFASDRPAQDAMQGIIYHKDGQYHLQDSEYAMDFELLDENCLCPSCQQSFTRAYLHHLLQSTPLLCQRFLLMHNVFYINHDFLQSHLPLC